MLSLTQRLWVFNPGHEEALLAPTSSRYTLSKEIRQMRHELAEVLQLLARPSDFLYVPPSVDGALPARLLRGSGQVCTEGELPRRLEVRLWALDPHILRELRESVLFRHTELVLPEITPRYLQLSHRRASTDLLRFLVDEAAYPSYLLPTWLEAGEEREATVERLRQVAQEVMARGVGDREKLLVKRPYSSSGRGVLPLPLPLQAKHLEAFAGSCHRVGSLSVEPCFQVQDNWAIEYERRADGRVHFFALSHFETLPSGRAYARNLLASPAELWEELTKRVGQVRLERLVSLHRTWLEEALRGSGYVGYMGIDLFLYVAGGETLLHPAVEINLRTTMGVLAHEAYQRYFTQGERGSFLVIYQRERVPAFSVSIEREGVQTLLSGL